MKVTAAMLKENAKVAPEVAAEVAALQKRWNTRKVSFEMKDPSWRLYLAEGADYTFFYHGERRSAHMMSEFSLHAGGQRIEHLVGEYTPTMPQGTWVVEFELFLGKPFINIMHVGLLALKAA